MAQDAFSDSVPHRMQLRKICRQVAYQLLIWVRIDSAWSFLRCTQFIVLISVPCLMKFRFSPSIWFDRHQIWKTRKFGIKKIFHNFRFFSARRKFSRCIPSNWHFWKFRMFWNFNFLLFFSWKVKEINKNINVFQFAQTKEVRKGKQNRTVWVCGGWRPRMIDCLYRFCLFTSFLFRSKLSCTLQENPTKYLRIEQHVRCVSKKCKNAFPIVFSYSQVLRNLSTFFCCFWFLLDQIYNRAN